MSEPTLHSRTVRCFFHLCYVKVTSDLLHWGRIANNGEQPPLMSQRGYDNCQGQSRRRRKIKIRQDYVAIVFFCRSRRVAKAETISNHRRFQWPQGRFAPPPTPPRILLLGCFRCQPIVTKRPKVRVTIDNLPLVIGPPNGKLFLFKSAAMAKAGRRAGRNQFRLPFTRI